MRIIKEKDLPLPLSTRMIMRDDLEFIRSRITQNRVHDINVRSI